MTSVGIIAASFIMVLKRGDPVTLLILARSAAGRCLLSGQLMPQWLQKLSWLLPITYSLDGMRRALLPMRRFRRSCPTSWRCYLFGLVLVPISSHLPLRRPSGQGRRQPGALLDRGAIQRIRR